MLSSTKDKAAVFRIDADGSAEQRVDGWRNLSAY
jgi:hypothetical protein